MHPYAWPAVRRGGERYLHDLASWLDGAGHDVRIVTSGVDGPDRVDGVAVERRPRNRWLVRGREEGFALTALGALRGREVDLVHALTPGGAAAAALAGLPTVFTELGVPAARWLRRRRTLWSVWRTAVRTAAAVTVLSDAAAAGMRTVGDREPWIVPPGVRADRFSPDLSPRGGPPVLLFPSDLEARNKGLDHLLGALRFVLEHHPDARLVLAGPGDPAWALSSADPDVLAATDHAGTGDLEGVADRYRAATVTVLPSRNEAFGLVLAESLACGTPIVATGRWGPGQIASLEVGRTAPYADRDALASALLEAIDLARDAATPARCVERAARWSWGAVGPEHERVYRAVLGEVVDR